MSAGIICDQCGTTLALKPNGDDETGEVASWLNIKAANMTADLCTRSCAEEWLRSPEVAAAMDEYAERIAEIVRVISDDAEDTP